MDDYKFLKIEDAITCINQKVNLLAVVLDFSLPQKSKGTDYFCKLKIIDDSHHKYGIPVHLFSDHVDDLPHVESIGDIIQLSRVMMKIHEGDVYAIFNKKYSSFALYEGKHGEGFRPYQVSLRFRARQQDEKLIKGMRKWLADSKVIDVPMNFALLREINEVDRLNLVCKVLHVCEIAADEWMVFLWDGTDAPPVVIRRKLEVEMHNQLPLHLEPLPSIDLLHTFPTVGTILRMTTAQDCRKYSLQILKIGQWLKLFNVSCKVHEGLWYAVFTPSTRIQKAPNEDILVLERQSDHDQRLSCNLERMPYWSFPWPSRITEVSCSDVTFATLMDVLTCQKVRKKFRCVLRVVAAIPWQVEDLRAPCGTYRVRFTVEDPTARIHAFAYGEDAEKFFDGCSTADELTRKLNKLLGVAVSVDGKEFKDAARNPPWVQCCLKSKYLSNSKTNICKICDTKLVG